MILKAEKIAALTAEYSYRDENGKIMGNEINYDLLASDIVMADNERHGNITAAALFYVGGASTLWAIVGFVLLIGALDYFVEYYKSNRKFNELCEFEDAMITKYPGHLRKPTIYGYVRLETTDGKIHEYPGYSLTDTGHHTYCGSYLCNHPICALDTAINFDTSKAAIVVFIFATYFFIMLCRTSSDGLQFLILFPYSLMLYATAILFWMWSRFENEIREYIANGTIGGKNVTNKGYKYDREILKKELLAYDKAKGIETRTSPAGTISKPTEIKSRNTGKTPGGAIGREIKDMIDFFIRMFGPEK
jgi:hypothetical protein